MPLSRRDALARFRHRLFDFPWEQQEELNQLLVEQQNKNPTQITGEYFVLYRNWLAAFMAKDGCPYPTERANFAIVMAIIRQIGIQNIPQQVNTEHNDGYHVVLYNCWFRFLCETGIEDQGHKGHKGHIPSQYSRLFESRYATHPTEFVPCLTEETFSQILQMTDIGVLEDVSKAVFRGKYAYQFNPEDCKKNISKKLPFPGEDVLHAHYYRAGPLV